MNHYLEIGQEDSIVVAREPRQRRRAGHPFSKVVAFLKIFSSALFLSVLLSPAHAGELHHDFPQTYAPEHRYIIYVHGRIIETDGVDAVSPRFGLYEYTGIIRALAQGDAEIIAHVRQGDTDGDGYADYLVQQISTMISQGVPPENITLAGFSKGGYITLLTANSLQNPSLRYVVMAGCTQGIVEGDDARADGLQGAILSMAEASDDIGFSCAPLFSRNPQLSEVNHITFLVGTGHGFFYGADSAWIDEVLLWSYKGAN